MGAEFEIQGLDEILTRFQDIGLNQTKIENAALKFGGGVVAKRASQNAKISNINHLHLAQNVKVSKVKVKDGYKFVEIAAGKETFWDKFQEFGTSQQPAQPWLQPSFEESKDEAIEAMKQVIKKGLGI